MAYIIVTRHVHGGFTAITSCADPNEQNPPFMEFEQREEAIAVAEENPLCRTFGYNILEVDL